MILDRDEVKKLYDRMAGRYDLALIGYRLLGIDRQRRSLVAQFHLQPGDTVVDLGCGTGFNLPLLTQAVGATGKVIGVDLSAGMLERASQRISREKLENVELIEADLRDYALPTNTKAVIATFALEMVPDYEAVIQRVAASLPRDGRLGLLGLKRPEGWPEWLISVGIWLNRPFGVNRDYEALKPWKAVEQQMQLIEFQELYLGIVYRCLGQPKR